MPKERTQKELVVFKGAKRLVNLKGDFRNDTIWASQAEIASVFGIERSVVTKHLRNVYKEGELLEKATCAKFAQVQTEGKRSITRQIEYYNLDAIISVGYRLNSKTATQFRQWATTTLREHITKGFTINPSRIFENREAFLSAVEQVRKLLPASGEVGGSENRSLSDFKILPLRFVIYLNGGINSALSSSEGSAGSIV